MADFKDPMRPRKGAGRCRRCGRLLSSHASQIEGVHSACERGSEGGLIIKHIHDRARRACEEKAQKHLITEGGCLKINHNGARLLEIHIPLHGGPGPFPY